MGAMRINVPKVGPMARFIGQYSDRGPRGGAVLGFSYILVSFDV